MASDGMQRRRLPQAVGGQSGEEWVYSKQNLAPSLTELRSLSLLQDYQVTAAGAL